ncbi:MAG: hypothetical protein JWO79_2642 [Actinomycetia bacterium]|nr:hypothetical protein [Actinomycetes bacterium]
MTSATGQLDLLLLFPGVTEARHFPYLSLPQLTAYCRARGYVVAQRDHNIELSRALLAPDALARRLRLADSLSRLRAATLHYLSERSGAGVPASDVDTRIELNGVDAMLSGSALTTRVERLADLVNVARTPLAEDDVAGQVYEQLVREAICGTRPRVIGFSVAFFSQLVPAIRAALIAREVSPESAIVFGGQQIMLREAGLRRCRDLLEIVTHLSGKAGERVLPELLGDRTGNAGRAAEPNSPTATLVPRWRFRDNPSPQFDGLPLDRYFSGPPQLPVISCIGCYWGKCTFCSYGNRSLTDGYQQLDHLTLAAWVIAGLEQTGARRVTFVDENSNIKLLLNAMTVVRGRGFDVVWSTRNRMEPVLTSAAFCRRLASAGCVLMSVGYETVSQRLLDSLDKGVRADTYQAIIDNLHDAGIALRLSVMGGIPTETADEAVESRRFLVRNAHKLGIDVAQMLMVEPRTLLDLGDPSGIARRGGETLLDNTGFSYLGGRVGAAFDYTKGPSRAERSQWLADTIDAVLPSKNDEQHPRFASATTPKPIGRLALHPWVVESADPRTAVLHDVRWKLNYRLPAGLHREGRVLVATDDGASRALGLLLQAEAGREVDTGDNS